MKINAKNSHSSINKINADAKKLKTKNSSEKTECEAIILWIVLLFN